jgi:hypothetical protein
MTDPINSFHTTFGRFYNHPKFALDALLASGAVFGADYFDPSDPLSPNPSVTNVIGVMDKAFLPPYYAKLVAEHAVANLDEIRYQVERFGPQVAIGALKAVPNRPNGAAAIGDEVHAAIDAYVKGAGGTPEFSTSTASSMYAQWLHFASAHSPGITRSEFTVWSYEHGYAGTGDLMWESEGGLWLVDTKTGSGVHPEVALQTAALARADVILSPDGTEEPMPAVDVLGVIHVRPRSVKLYRIRHGEQAFDAFLACKRIFDFRRFYAGQVIPALPDVKTEKPKEAKASD